GSHAWVRQLNAGLIPLDASTSLPVHPTQIYSALSAFAVLGLLLLYARRRRLPGELMSVLMIVYPLSRWPVEFLRSDESTVFAGMTWSQNISVFLIVCGLALRAHLRKSAFTFAGQDLQQVVQTQRLVAAGSPHHPGPGP